MLQSMGLHRVGQNGATELKLKILNESEYGVDRSLLYIFTAF